MLSPMPQGSVSSIFDTRWPVPPRASQPLSHWLDRRLPGAFMHPQLRAKLSAYPASAVASPHFVPDGRDARHPCPIAHESAFAGLTPFSGLERLLPQGTSNMEK